MMLKPTKQFTLIALCAKALTPLAPAQDGRYKLDRTKQDITTHGPIIGAIIHF
jgi:hypothetical protein